jgi:hypothetical protein
MHHPKENVSFITLTLLWQRNPMLCIDIGDYSGLSLLSEDGLLLVQMEMVVC